MGKPALWLLAAGLACAGWRAAVGDEMPAGPLFPTDGRLARRLDVDRGRVYLGELLETLARETGVPLAADAGSAPADGLDLTVVVRSRPLREVMAGLEGLLTTRFNQWEWQRAGARGYVLRSQRRLEDAAQAARQDLFTRWSADLRTYCEIARLAEPARTQRAQARRDLFPGGQVDGRLMTLVATLAPDQVAALLRGVPVALDERRLPTEAARALAGLPPPGSGGGTADFRVTWEGDQACPVLWVRSGEVSVSTLGSFVWEDSWLGRACEGWSRVTDADVQEHLRRQVARDPALGQPLRAANLPEWVATVARRQGSDVLAVLGGSGEQSGWLGRTPDDTARALVLRGRLMTRRLDGLLLVRRRTFPTDAQRHATPWARVRELRRGVERNGGYLTLSHLLGLSELRTDQLTGLQEEFPGAEPRLIGAWRPILRFEANLTPANRERLRRAAGLPFREAGLLARAALLDEVDTDNVRNLPLLQTQARQVLLRLWEEAVEVPERRRADVRDAPPAPRHAQQAVWQAWVPDGPVHRRAYRQEPRRPLVPHP